jgi:hypothetical protein
MDRVLTKFRLEIDGTSPLALRELRGACEALDDAQVMTAKLFRQQGISVITMAWPGTVRELAKALGEQTRHNPDVTEYGGPVDADELKADLAAAQAARKQMFGGRAVFPSQGRRP